jgi:hypothetical protein
MQKLFIAEEGEQTMTNQGLKRSQRTKLTARYRGGFICRQEYGYKLITMIVNLLTPEEQSIVTTCDCGFTFTEEAKHIPLGSPLAAVDLYHFAVTDGTEIELTIRSPQEEYQTHYIVSPTDTQEDAPFLWLDIITLRRSDETTRFSDER